MAPSAWIIVALILTGVGASIIGSIVGLGGGFITVPVLRIFFNFSPAVAAAASLMLVFANSLSASARFAHQKRIAFDLAIPIAVASIPGSIAGALISARTNGNVFDILYAVLLSVIAIDVVRRTLRKTPAVTDSAVAVHGRPHLAVIIAGGLIVGFISSLFGIGGGVIVVPLLLYTTKKDLHVVTATSTAIIAMTAPVGIITQSFQHQLHWQIALALAAGGLVGGQIGAVYSQRLSSSVLSLVLAIAMVAAAAGMVLRHVI